MALCIKQSDEPASKRTDLTQRLVLCKNKKSQILTYFTPKEASIYRGTILEKNTNRLGASPNYSSLSSIILALAN